MDVRSIYAIAIDGSPHKSGPVKIGVAKRPLARMSELQTGNHKPLCMLLSVNCSNPMLVERDIHQFLEHTCCLSRRGEWFNIAPAEAVFTVLAFAFSELGLLNEGGRISERAVEMLCDRSLQFHTYDFDVPAGTPTLTHLEAWF